MTGSRARAAPRAGPGSVTGTAPRAPTGSGRSWGKSLPLRSGESPEGMGRAPLPPGSCGSRTGAAPYYCAPSPSTTRLSIVQWAFLVEVAGNRRLLPGLAAVGCRRGGAGGAPGTTRGGRLSKSVAKAPRTGIGREKNRGISTILLRHSGAIRAFATDLDKRRRRGPRGGAPRVGWRSRGPHRRPGCPWRGGGSRGVPGRRPRGPREAAPDRLLRPFPSAAPLRPPLHEKKRRSGGRRGAAKGKERSGRGPGRRFQRLQRLQRFQRRLAEAATA